MALMPEVQFLLSDPELGAQSFDITRRTAKWVGGMETDGLRHAVCDACKGAWQGRNACPLNGGDNAWRL